MGRVLLQYMSQRLSEINLKSIKKRPGPVITISRAAGCSCYPISKIIEQKLNETETDPPWQVISKAILHQSAEQLNLHPEKIAEIVKTKERSLMEDVVHAFLSSDYQIEKKVYTTIVNVIRHFANEGNKIILGRGGCVICEDIPKSIHVRIDAPTQWKIDAIITTKGLSREEAIKYIEDTETNRRNFRQMIKGKKENCEMFDLIINQSKFTNEEIADIIISAFLKIL